MSGLSVEIVEGMRAGARLNVARPIEIGRDPGADLVLDDELVSRRHVRISPSERGVVVEDLDSRNGTFVNGARVYGPTAVNAGDKSPSASPSSSCAPPSRWLRDLRPPILSRRRSRSPTATRLRDARHPRRAAREREHALTPLLDVHTKRMARTAPLAVFVLVVLVVIIFLATR